MVSFLLRNGVETGGIERAKVNDPEKGDGRQEGGREGGREDVFPPAASKVIRIY